MEQLFGLPTIALRNVPDKVINQLYQVTATTGHTDHKDRPVAILDGTKIVSRLHLGAAVRRALLAAAGKKPTASNNADAAAAIAAPLKPGEARPVSPARLHSPNRRKAEHQETTVKLQEERKNTKSPTRQQQNSNTNNKADDAAAMASTQQGRVASQIIFYLSPTRSNAVRNFVLGAVQQTHNNNQDDDAAAASAKNKELIHSSAVLVFDADILPAEAWRWVKSSGAMEHVVSMDTLQSTINADAICEIYSLGDGVASSSNEQQQRMTGHLMRSSKSNMPGQVSVRDVSWIEKQVVSKIATANI